MAIEDTLKTILEENHDDPAAVMVFNHVIAEITKLRKQIILLKARDDTLSKLEAAGVDNWEGYSEAFQDDDEDEE